MPRQQGNVCHWQEFEEMHCKVIADQLLMYPRIGFIEALNLYKHAVYQNLALKLGH